MNNNSDSPISGFAQLVGEVEQIRLPAVSPNFGNTRKTRQQIRIDAQHVRNHPRFNDRPVAENFDDLPTPLFQAMGHGRLHYTRVIDLHGQTVDQATRYLNDALSNRRNRHLTFWLVVHGKGRNSPAYDKAPVKNAVLETLRRHPGISAIHALLDRDADSGAVVIALRAKESVF